MVAGVELNYNSNATALQMAQLIFGNGVTVNNASYVGDQDASAIFSGGDTISPDVTPSDTGVILSTGEAQAFTRNGTESNISNSTTTANSGPNGDGDFNTLAGTSTFDASYLIVDFTPDTGVNVISMDFVLSSEEYPEFSNSIYNDVIGVWINGSNVPISVGDGTSSVGNINQTSNLNLYQDNTADQVNTEMDGYTITLTLNIPVNPGTNTIKIGIADVADNRYDSNLLIAANSVQGTLVAQDDVDTIYPDGSRTIDVLANDINNTGGTLSITSINGETAVVGMGINLPAGQVATLNSDGTITVDADSDVEDINFTYEVQSTTGEIDTGFVTITTIPCFVAGTHITTPNGERPVEALEIGDLVLTRDDGPQPVRWIGRRELPATGDMAPVVIREGTLGDHRDLVVSPNHRILISGREAELLFGEDEVLVAAKDLVNDGSIRIRDGGTVEYVHVMFDRHQVIYSEGWPTESFLPGSQTTACFEKETLEEICKIFPELDPATGSGYSSAARRTLKSYEAKLFRSDQPAAAA